MKITTDELPGLRHRVRDLAALTALSADWDRAEVHEIASGLAQALLRILPVEFVYVQAAGAAGATVHEAVHFQQGPVGQARSEEIGKALELALKSDAGESALMAPTFLSLREQTGMSVPPQFVPDPFGEGELPVAAVPIGVDGNCGIVIAGSRQWDFPTPTDAVLLQVGANQAAVVLQHRRFEEALEAERRRNRFLATMAHELRNPLAPIRNAVQILHVKGLPETEAHWARDVIDRQAQLMSRLVDDLLDLSRISQGRLGVRKERINLGVVLNTALEASRPNLAKWGHELTINLPNEPVFLDADPTRLEQVLLNLLNNAAKFTPQGGHVWLTVQLDDGQVVIRVKDNGIGIPPDKLPSIFEIFTQVDCSLGRSHEGLGIGLALVQQLVKMHGGTIEARSPGTGQGSEFIVRLPVAVGSVPSPDAKPGGTGFLARPALDGLGRPSHVQDPSTHRILVVDDNKDAANCLAKLLRKSGNEVHTAYDGLEAVEAAAAFQPSLILLDIGLPKLDGYEVVRRIRSQPRSQHVVFIAVTGWGQEEDRRLSREAGFNYHLIKPIETEALQRLLAGLDPME